MIELTPYNMQKSKLLFLMTPIGEVFSSYLVIFLLTLLPLCQLVHNGQTSQRRVPQQLISIHCAIAERQRSLVYPVTDSHERSLKTILFFTFEKLAR